VAKLNFRPRPTRIEFTPKHVEAQRQTLERLYERKATLEALIHSLEEYARCRASVPPATVPLSQNEY
jgi:hypothetical protein